MAPEAEKRPPTKWCRSIPYRREGRESKRLRCTVQGQSVPVPQGCLNLHPRSGIALHRNRLSSVVLAHISPHCAITTSMFGTSLPLYPVFVASILLTTSMPSTTLPNTTCFPSRKGVGTVVMKNCEPLEFGPAFCQRVSLTIDGSRDTRGAGDGGRTEAAKERKWVSKN